jgi:hypothetical protein
MSPVFAIVLYLALGALNADAAIPPSSTIIKRLALKQQGLKPIRIQARLIQWENDTPSSVQLRETALYDPKTKTLTTELVTLDGRLVYSLRRVLRGSAPAESPPTSWLLLSDDADSITRTLKSHFIPIRTESELSGFPTEKEKRDSELTRLGRLDGKIAWVIGAKPDSDTQDPPELWIEKDVFNPLRWKTTAAEVRFGKSQAFSGVLLPAELRLIIGTHTHAQLIIDQVVVEVDPKSSVERKTVFSEDAISSEMRDLVRLYSRYLR